MVTIANFRESQYPIVAGTRCIKVVIPDDDTFKQLLAGLLALPGVETNYAGDDPAKAAELAQQWINAYIDTDWEGCEPEMTLPIGTIYSLARHRSPTGFLYCDGNIHLKADYPLLWDAITTLWGEVEDEDYFQVPDFRNRSPYGYDYGGSPAHFPFASEQGAETVALTASQNGAHSHLMGDTATGSAETLIFGAVAQGNGTPAVPYRTHASGSGAPHNNLHPVAVCGFIIYAGA